VFFVFKQETAVLGESYQQQRYAQCVEGKTEKQRHSSTGGIKGFTTGSKKFGWYSSRSL